MPKRRNKKSRCLSSSTFPSRPEYFSASSFASARRVVQKRTVMGLREAAAAAREAAAEEERRAAGSPRLHVVPFLAEGALLLKLYCWSSSAAFFSLASRSSSAFSSSEPDIFSKSA